MIPSSHRLLLLPALLLVAACSQARSPAVYDGPMPAVLQTLQSQGVELHGQFDAPVGLQGHAASMDQQTMAVYVTADGQYALVGVMIDAKGQDVGLEAVQRLASAPMADRAWAALSSSRWVADGREDAARVIYTFSDPNCPFCNRFWHAARPWVEAGKVQLRHVMVGVVRADSAGKAAAILADANPEQALARNERHYADGGIQGITVSPAMEATLAANVAVMQSLGFQGTPALVFKDAQGQLQRRSGLPSPEDMEQILGPL